LAAFLSTRFHCDASRIDDLDGHSGRSDLIRVTPQNIAASLPMEQVLAAGETAACAYSDFPDHFGFAAPNGYARRFSAAM
jgi:hypothetical protein